MFELNDATAKVANYNPRAEKHGDENKMAGDLKLLATTGSAVLDFFNKDLRKTLYRKPNQGEQQDLIEGSDGLTAVKFPRLGALQWDEEYPGYHLVIGSGLGLSEPMVLKDVTLKRFRFEALDGGSVSVGLSALFHPTPEQAGQLCALIQEDVQITLIPPTKQAKGSKPQQDDLAA
ncbi:hypothetical protein [Stenotrophomonas sp.]|uniref:hypothetical protein n=1 Tax=Stenotrophomonas sp. TaxID=69392 RepID=UPI00289C86B1|nr:hypothetical protein [Stenotrophomonas sp.]